MARKLDIASNPAPNAVFEPLSSGFNVWCTHQDYPQGGGWEEIVPDMVAGAFTKPCEFVGTVTWGWDDDERISYLVVETDAMALRDKSPLCYPKTKNRPVDVEWVKEKVKFLFELAGVPILPFVLSDEDDERERQRAEREDAFEDAVNGVVERVLERIEPEDNTPVIEKVYRGDFDHEGNIVVTVNNRLLPVISMYSGEEFAWGYGGTGPRVLARSILADFFGEKPTAEQLKTGQCRCVRHSLAFVRDFLVELEQSEGWVILGKEIQKWLEELGEEGDELSG